jgi:hypothetical protein
MRYKNYQFEAPPVLVERVETFKRTTGLKTDAEATRHLVLKGLEAAGVPLAKPPEIDLNKLGLV